MLFAEVAAASQVVAASSARNEKVAALARALRDAEPGEVRAVAAWLSGATLQRRTGIGWASLREAPPAAEVATLTVTAVDDALTSSAGASGAGSAGVRQELVARLLGAATRPEQRLLAGLLAGELRQGAGAGLMLPAVAAAAGVPVDAVRRAVAVHGDLPDVAFAALTGGAAALGAFSLAVGRGLSPMLAQPGSDLDVALGKTGAAGVEWKLDGVRAQLHRDGDDVAVFTRTLDDITDRVPEVVAAVRALPVNRAILDGELLAYGADRRPAPFQVTNARVMTRAASASTDVPLGLTLFDVLHADGEDLIDRPGSDRRSRLEAFGGDLLVPRHVVDDPTDDEQRSAATAFAAGALAAGHEGVVVKGLTVPYTMGRRGGRLGEGEAAHHARPGGAGRRVGARSAHRVAVEPAPRRARPRRGVRPAGRFRDAGQDVQGPDRRHAALADRPPAGHRDRRHRLGGRGKPELVVEIAFDGVQSSPRYPAGMALRFARVLAHRPDKPAAQADTVATVRGYHQGVASEEP